MKVAFERTGGLAGIRVAATIDSESLTEEEARHLGGLVEEAGFFDLSGEIPDPAGVADGFLYTLTVEDQGQRHTVRTGEAAASQEVRALVRWLGDYLLKG